MDQHTISSVIENKKYLRFSFVSPSQYTFYCKNVVMKEESCTSANTHSSALMLLMLLLLLITIIIIIINNCNHTHLSRPPALHDIRHLSGDACRCIPRWWEGLPSCRRRLEQQ